IAIRTCSFTLVAVARRLCSLVTSAAPATTTYRESVKIYGGCDASHEHGFQRRSANPAPVHVRRSEHLAANRMERRAEISEDDRHHCRRPRRARWNLGALGALQLARREYRTG